MRTMIPPAANSFHAPHNHACVSASRCTTWRCARHPLLLLMPLMTVLASGCGTDIGYLFYAAGGALESIGNTRPVSDVLEDGSLTPEQEQKLRFVLRLREFAEDIGLSVGDAYSLYEDNAEGPTAYAVSAAYKDRLEPVRFEFPIIGALTVKGYFDLELAQDEARRLEEEGYDVFLGVVEGFSTLGILPDPIRASNLTLDDVALAEFLFHELTHNTIFKLNDADFNESMATFVGRAAAQRYFDTTFGPSSAESFAAAQRFADLRVIDDFVVDLYATMADHYAQPISSSEKVAGRDAVFANMRQRYTDEYAPRLADPERYAHIPDIAVNNAVVLAGTLYQAGLELYQQVFDKLNGDFVALREVLRDAADAENSRAYLRGWLEAQP